MWRSKQVGGSATAPVKPVIQTAFQKAARPQQSLLQHHALGSQLTQGGTKLGGVDANARFSGVVKMYNKFRGFGFITPSQALGGVHVEAVYVHWTSIQSMDRFPFLQKELPVEFSITSEESKWAKGCPVAANVTLMGSQPVALQDQVDAEKKSFVGGMELRYSGLLKFFDPKRGFGIIDMDEGYAVDSTVPKTLKVETPEINAGGAKAVWMEKLNVEFGIWKTKHGAYKAYNMTLPGGLPADKCVLENRVAAGSQSFIGVVTSWNWRKGWGFIKPDHPEALPQAVKARMVQQAQQAVQKATGAGKQIDLDELIYFRKTDVQDLSDLKRDVKASFQLYMDDTGVGAHQVRVLL